MFNRSLCTLLFHKIRSIKQKILQQIIVFMKFFQTRYRYTIIYWILSVHFLNINVAQYSTGLNKWSINRINPSIQRLYTMTFKTFHEHDICFKCKSYALLFKFWNNNIVELYNFSTWVCLYNNYIQKNKRYV